MPAADGFGRQAGFGSKPLRRKASGIPGKYIALAIAAIFMVVVLPVVLIASTAR